MDQQWSLLCLLAQSAFEVILETRDAENPHFKKNKDKKKGAPFVNWQDRFTNLYECAKSTLETYADKDIGSFVSGEFYKSAKTGKPAWHPSVVKIFYALRDKGGREWPTWQNKGGSKCFTADEKKHCHQKLRSFVTLDLIYTNPLKVQMCLQIRT